MQAPLAAATAHKVEAATKKFYAFVETIKAEVLNGVEVNEKTGKLDYEAMDKADNLDNSLMRDFKFKSLIPLFLVILYDK